MDPEVTGSGVETAPSGGEAGHTTAGQALGAQIASPAIETATTPENQANETTDGEGAADTGSDTADKRDFRAYAKKLEAENRSFKDRFRELEVKPAAKIEGVRPETGQAPQTEAEALSLLQSVVEKSIDSRLAPLLEEQVLTEFEGKAYVKELGPEIQAELVKLPSSTPLRERLETARVKAIAANIDAIAASYHESGKAAAYGNQATKQAQAGVTGRESQANQPGDNLLDRVLKGQVPTAEYAERKGEIDQLIKEHTFNNPGIV